MGEITYKERMINVSQNCILTYYVICLFVPYDVCFFKPFHGVEFASLLVLAEHHSTEGTSP